MISLVGLPGSGKTTVGRKLAHRLGVSFLDTDQTIEREAGCSIRDIFARDGESRFRDLEQQTLLALVEQHSGVLSTGGGVVLRAPNREVLRERTSVVYLRSSPDELFRRLRHDKTRPLLQVADPLQRLQELFATRDPLYRETAHWVVDTGQPSVSSLVTMIEKKIGAGLRPNSAPGEAGQGITQSNTDVSSA